MNHQEQDTTKWQRELLNGLDQVAKPYFPAMLFNASTDGECDLLKDNSLCTKVFSYTSIGMPMQFYQVLMFWLALIGLSGEEQNLLMQEICQDKNIDKLFPNSESALVAVKHWHYMLHFELGSPLIFDGQSIDDRISIFEKSCSPQWHIFLKALAEKVVFSGVFDDVLGINFAAERMSVKRIDYHEDGKHLKYFSKCFVAVYSSCLLLMTARNNEGNNAFFVKMFFDDLNRFITQILGLHGTELTLVQYSGCCVERKLIYFPSC